MSLRSKLSTSVLEQGILGLANFSFIFLAARAIPPSEFGLFSIFWSFLILQDSIVASIFGDNMPSIFFNAKKEDQPSLLFIFHSFSLLLVFILSGAVIYWATYFYQATLEPSELFFYCTGACFMRLQQTFRREAFLLGRSTTGLISAITYAATLTLMYWSIIRPEGTSRSDIACTLCASYMTATIVFLGTSTARCTKKYELWISVTKQFWSSGRWLLGASLIYWVSGSGMIPFVGYFFGTDKGGMIRIYQNLSTPLTQAGAAIMITILPRFAKNISEGKIDYVFAMTKKIFTVMAIFAFLYTFLTSFFGDALISRVLAKDTNDFSLIVMAMVIGMSAIEFARQPIATYLNAAGASNSIFWGRTLSLIGAAFSLPLIYFNGSLEYVILLFLAGSILNIVFLYSSMKFAKIKYSTPT